MEKDKTLDFLERFSKDKQTHTTETVKALVRPYLICSAWTAMLVMACMGVGIPEVLEYIIYAITGEYGLERIVKRMREKIDGKYRTNERPTWKRNS